MQSKQIITVVAISLSLAFACLFGYGYVTTLIAWQVEPLHLTSTGMLPPGRWELVFAFLAIIPAYLIIALLMKVRTLLQSLLIVTMILVMGFIFWEMELLRMRETGNELNISSHIRLTVSLENLNLHWHAVIGMVVGALLGALIVYRNNRKQLQ